MVVVHSKEDYRGRYLKSSSNNDARNWKGRVGGVTRIKGRNIPDLTTDLVPHLS